MRDASTAAMELSAHSQFITVLVIALGALVAAPTVVYLFEWRRSASEERPRRERRAPIAQPELQPT